MKIVRKLSAAMAREAGLVAIGVAPSSLNTLKKCSQVHTDRRRASKLGIQKHKNKNYD